MVNKSYKQKAILGIISLCNEWDISIPEIYIQDISNEGKLLSLNTTEIKKRISTDIYTQGRVIGQIRSLVDLFNLTNKDFE